MKHKKLSRRDFMSKSSVIAGGLNAGLLDTFVNCVLNGYVNRAHAQEMKINPRSLMYVQLPGGPQRWVFDQFLNPYSSAGLLPSPQLFTKYSAVGGRYTGGGGYQTVNIRGIQAPWMWQFNVPAANGGVRPMADLLDNLIALQGLDATTNDHDLARRLVFSPLGTNQSLPALAADYSSSPIPSVHSNVDHMEFVSKAGKSSILLEGTGNLITSLMDPFTRRTSAAFNSRRDGLSTLLADASTKLSIFAASRNPGAATIGANLKTAEDLLASALGDLSAQWAPLVTKYESLISRSLDRSNPVPGVTDMPVGKTTSRANDPMYIQPGDVYVSTPDLRDIVPAGAKIRNLAQNFALGEILLKNKLTQSYSCSLEEAALKLSYPENANGFWQADEHICGAMISLLTNTLVWRAFAACMLELITQLKSANVFNETVIALVGDFGRFPESNGSGSGHSAPASNATFYSGAIAGPHVLGRIYKRSPDPNYTNHGTWGEGDRSRDYGSMLTSLATMLRVPSPLTAQASMIAESNSAILPVAEKTTLI